MNKYRVTYQTGNDFKSVVVVANAEREAWDKAVNCSWRMVVKIERLTD